MFACHLLIKHPQELLCFQLIELDLCVPYLSVAAETEPSWICEHTRVRFFLKGSWLKPLTMTWGVRMAN